MKIFDKKSIVLNNGSKDVEVEVYMKEVAVRNNHKNIKAFCKIVGSQ